MTTMREELRREDSWDGDSIDTMDILRIRVLLMFCQKWKAEADETR